MEVVGRAEEIGIMMDVLEAKKSHFLAIYGRRRIGKTFLIDEVYAKHTKFALTGLSQETVNAQLQNFTDVFKRQTKKVITKPKNWLAAFEVLKQYLEKLPEGKKVIFIDELPWLCSSRSGFLSSIENFWNAWASKRKDILLVVCGSAASWMIKNIIHNKGGLYNRVTQTIRLMPFTLKETSLLLQKNGIEFTPYQITQLYMIMGGIPHYLMQVKKGMSIDQVINSLCFKKDGLLRNEFMYIFKSLFSNTNNYVAIIKELSQKAAGLSRSQIIKATKLTNAGSTTRMLEDLEESGFISKQLAYNKNIKDANYRLTDFYSLFYTNYIEKRKATSNTYYTLTKLPEWNTWQGLMFENICKLHVTQIKNKLGISGVNTLESSWKKIGTKQQEGIQIDLLIDRDDKIINICEVKFVGDTYLITKDYAAKLRNKKSIFKATTKTRKSIFITLISTYGIVKNAYAFEGVQSEVLLEDLFE